MESFEGRSALTARGESTRARIVDAAADLVHFHGAAGTSLDAVRAATGTSKSQLYHYFRDKDDLILAVVERQAEQVLAGNEALLRDLHSLAGLRHWRDVLVAANEQDGDCGGCPLGSLVGELAEVPRLREALEAGFARWEGLFAAGFERMRQNGELRPDTDGAELAIAVLGALQGGLLLAQACRNVRPLALSLNMAVAFVGSFAVAAGGVEAPGNTRHGSIA